MARFRNQNFSEIANWAQFSNDPVLNSFTGGELIVSDEFLSSLSPNVNYTLKRLIKQSSGIRLDNGITLNEDFGNFNDITFFFNMK